MSVAGLIEFRVKPQERERFLGLLNDVLDAMRHEATFRGATLHVDPADACRFLLHEVWDDYREVMEVQIARPYRQAWHEALPELLERPREIGLWTPLRTDPPSGTSPAR